MSGGHDMLTGLANRTHLVEKTDEILRALRDGLVAVYCIDLDGFKAANESLGHHAGDALLYQVSQRLERCVGQADILARIGGDEFGVVQGSTGARRAPAVWPNGSLRSWQNPSKSKGVVSRRISVM